MYGVELYAAVRLAVVEEGLSHREAGRRFGIDRRTVKKMLSYSAPPGYRRSKPVRRPKLEGFTGIEHRAARGLDDIEIGLKEDGEEPSFRLRQPPSAHGAPQPETPERRVLKALAAAKTPLSQRQIRERASTRHKTVGVILQKLVQEGRIERNAGGGYTVVAGVTDKPPPVDPINGSTRPQAPRFPIADSADA